jgi:uncharacterized protein
MSVWNRYSSARDEASARYVCLSALSTPGDRRVYNSMMRALTPADILHAFQSNRESLTALGVRDIALFGSFARGEQKEHSDVDVLVELEGATFDRYMDVRDFLTSLLGREVDLVMADALKPRLRRAILTEAIRAA